MRNILLTTTMAVGLGLAGPSFAQSQQPDASGGQAACQPGDPNCPGDGSAGEAGGAAGQSMEGQAGDATQPPTDEQAGDETRPQTDNEQAGGETQPQAEDQASDETQPQIEEQAEAPDGKTDSGTTASIGDADVTVEQRTEIRQVISQVDVEPVRVDDIDVDISVGVAVPRTIEVHPLPPRIVEIVPVFEGYVFFVLADGRIVILQPDTYEIVYVIVV